MTESSAAMTSTGEVDAGGTGEHVLDKALVARDVNDADGVLARFEGREANVDGDAAVFSSAVGRSRCLSAP